MIGNIIFFTILGLMIVFVLWLSIGCWVSGRKLPKDPVYVIPCKCMDHRLVVKNVEEWWECSTCERAYKVASADAFWGMHSKRELYSGHKIVLLTQDEHATEIGMQILEGERKKRTALLNGAT